MVIVKCVQKVFPGSIVEASQLGTSIFSRTIEVLHDIIIAHEIFLPSQQAIIIFQLSQYPIDYLLCSF
jgi:hypothetical protein